MSHPAPAQPSPAAVRDRLKAWAQPQARAMRLASVIGMADVACIIGFAWGLSHTVTALFGNSGGFGKIAWPVAATVLSLAARSVLNVINQKLNAKIARSVIRHIRLDVIGQAVTGRITGADAGLRLNALFEDTEALEGYYARFRQASVQAAVIPLVIIALVALNSLVAGGILLLTLLPFAALMALLGMSSAAESGRQLDALSRLSNLFTDRIKVLPLIIAFGNSPRQARTLARAAQDVADRTLRVLKVAFITSAVLEFFSALSVALIAVYCGFYLLGLLPFPVPEILSFETAFFVLALSPEVYAPMRRLSAAYHDRQSAMAAAQRLMTIAIKPETSLAAPLRAAPALLFDNIVCGFADDPDFRIGPTRFEVLPGSVTALSGPTGSGKTTLLRALMGQGQMVSGAISVNGDVLNSDLSPHIAWVSQSPPILAGSLRDNLLLAGRHASDSDLNRVIAAVGLSDLVARRGLDAPVNERGSGLSGGERKRIGLARALLKDAPILLLDEPTADLDEAAEADLIGVLPALFAGRTVILSSHSPRVCALADQTVRLA